MRTCLRLGRGSNLVNLYHEFHHSDVLIGNPPNANSVLTRREMFLPSELGKDGPGESKDQYHRTRSDGEELKKKICSPCCFYQVALAGNHLQRPFIKHKCLGQKKYYGETMNSGFKPCTLLSFVKTAQIICLPSSSYFK